MRRFTFVSAIAAIALTAAPALSQGLDIGARAGVVFANAAGDDVENTSTKTGFGVGAHAAFSIAPMFSIRPELNYMQMGAEVDDPDISATINLDYIQIPILLALSLPSPGPSPYFFAGPAVSFEAGCNLEASAGGVSGSVDCDNPSADFFERKSMAWSVVGGAGIGFGLGVGQATIDVRYDMGLTSIDDSGADLDVKNRAFAIMLGYTIGLGL